MLLLTEFVVRKQNLVSDRGNVAYSLLVIKIIFTSSSLRIIITASLKKIKRFKYLVVFRRVHKIAKSAY